VRIVDTYRRGPGGSEKLIGSLRLVFALVLAVAAVAGCGDGGGGSPPAQAGKTVPRLTVQVSVLESDIAEYCAIRNSGGASAADEEKAAADVRELIRLARRAPDRRLGSDARPTVRDALAEVFSVLSSDCRDSPLQRQVSQELKASRYHGR
jgi:outer membrane murein-binding lipoprotein Lpp